MTDQHPITPPSEELLDKWESEWHHYRGHDTYEEFMAKQAAQWGADVELEKCCEWFAQEGYTPNTAIRLRDARRPKPLSEADQALAALREAEAYPGQLYVNGRSDTIRRALERLKAGGVAMTEFPIYASKLAFPTYVGYWRLGGHLHFPLTKKPNAFHRLMTTLLLGWEWIDLESIND
jgi:hypothetical protein